MECNYDHVSAHNSNNNNEYIYADPSQVSAEDDFLNEEDDQALDESFSVRLDQKLCKLYIEPHYNESARITRVCVLSKG